MSILVRLTSFWKSIFSSTQNTSSSTVDPTTDWRDDVETDHISTGYERDDDSIKMGSVADYEFPPWFWNEETTDLDRHRWMVQERCRRQMMRQGISVGREIEKIRQRQKRRTAAQSGAIDVKQHNERDHT